MPTQVDFVVSQPKAWLESGSIVCCSFYVPGQSMFLCSCDAELYSIPIVGLLLVDQVLLIPGTSTVPGVPAGTPSVYFPFLHFVFA